MIRKDSCFLEGIDRASVPWSPVLDKDACTECHACHAFCKQGVYELHDGIVDVTNPTACVLFCEACSSKCPAGAISFPDRISILKTMTRSRRGH